MRGIVHIENTMSYPVKIFVDAAGHTYAARQCDQRRSRTAGMPLSLYRTVHGRVVIYAGTWYPSQMSYRPYLAAVAHAQHAATIDLQPARTEAV